MTSELQIHEAKPEGFSPQVQVVCCYLEVDDKLLLLQRRDEKLQPEKWGIPGGKLEEGETPEVAARRELLEETGISSSVDYLSSLYIRKAEFDYICHLFKVPLTQTPPIRLSGEHQNYKWATSQELEELPLMDGGKHILAHYRALLPKKRAGASVNVYLILEQEGKILFHLRKNTGYCDGMWSLVAGHVEDGESAMAAMAREAGEEIGIEPLELKVAHVMHRKTNRLNVDIFFRCFSWKGALQNCEPQKCETLAFFSPDALPPNTVDYNVAALKNEEFYSEWGWDS